MTLKKILLGFGIISLGAAVIILERKNAKLTGRNEYLEYALKNEMQNSERKNQYIGRILTEFKMKTNK